MYLRLAEQADRNAESLYGSIFVATTKPSRMLSSRVLRRAEEIVDRSFLPAELCRFPAVCCPSRNVPRPSQLKGGGKDRPMTNTKSSPVWIVTARGAPPIRCSISDITPTSATLVIEPNVSVPDRFALYTSFKNRRGRPCKVVWRKERLVGFEFVERPFENEGGRRSGAST